MKILLIANQLRMNTSSYMLLPGQADCAGVGWVTVQLNLILEGNRADRGENVVEKAIILELQAAGVEVHGLGTNDRGVVQDVDVDVEQIGDLQSFADQC